MLHAITLKSFCAAIIHVHWQRHGDGTFRIHETIAMVLVDAQIIGNDLELSTGHSKHVIVVDSHVKEFGS